MLDLLELAVPVVGAPMAGGPSTAALAAAVSEAGGLGFLAAGYKTAETVAEEIAQLRTATSAPFGVNLFVVEPYEPDPKALDGYRRSIAGEAERLGVALGKPVWDDDDWQEKLAVILDTRPDVVSFTFGCPDEDVLRRLAQAGVHVTVTVTTPDEARRAEACGAASLCVQGPEAGGHRGTWDQTGTPDATPMLELVAKVASRASVAVIAGGGILDAAGVRAVLQRGAAAAQVGTAFLLADEAGTNRTHRAALSDHAFTHTDMTRSFTGRWARGLANRFMAEHDDAPAGYPQLHHVTAPLRAAAVAAGEAHLTNLWAGTGFAAARAVPAVDIVRALTPRQR